jgi:S-adenosylmethionine hydrolase
MQSPRASVHRFVASGVITLTTDFGSEGPFVAVMKGCILARYRAATLVDVTHEIPVHWPAEAGFWLARSFRYFPAGTVHVAVVDPGVGTGREILCVERDEHVFLAPDNGLLAAVIGANPEAVVIRVDPQLLGPLDLPVPSATFHGRDIFAPIAAALAGGQILPRELGEISREYVPDWVEEPVVATGQITGAILTVDHFGNLISNIDAGLVRKLEAPVVRVGTHRLPLLKTYGDVAPGEYLALINSFGVLEIARAEQSAADGLGVGRGAPVQVISRTGGR